MRSSPFWRADAPASPGQWDYLRDLQQKRLVTDEELSLLAGIDDLTQLTKGQASALIGLLRPEGVSELERRLAVARGQLPLV